MKPVITRIWHGTTRAEHADIYLDYLKKSGIPDYKNIDGNLSVEVWRKTEGDICHFWTVTKWNSFDSIKNFAGKQYEKARYYPDDKDYLLDFEEHVEHYETFEY
jgi:heme-degrading monooxygenase HmoA